LVDFDLEIKKAHSINMKEIELSQCMIDDNIKKSIILYNTAVGELKKGNFDLVINDLIKALSYNEGFTEAIKLMGLCYVNMKEYKKAEKTFKKLNKDVMYNELANEYIESLSIKKSMSEGITVTEAAENISNNKKNQFSVDKHPKGKIVISVLLTIIIIVGISANHFYPETSQVVLTKIKTSLQGGQEKIQANNKISDSNEKTDIKADENKVLLEENTDKISAQDKVSLEGNTVTNGKDESPQKNLVDSKSESDNYKNNTGNMLNDAEKFLNSESYEKAATVLINTKSRNLDNETKMRFNELWQRLKPNPMWKIYNDGNSLYKQNKYAEALPKLLITSEIEPNLDIMPWVTYQIGMCYKQTNENANALMYFNKVKDNYPKSQYNSYARMMISEIGN
jgi:tetratricopeptide (TPR) repeat protein